MLIDGYEILSRLCSSPGFSKLQTDSQTQQKGMVVLLRLSILLMVTFPGMAAQLTPNTPR